jgi:hypothetical protein
MEQGQFLRRLLGDNGNYCLVTIKKGKSGVAQKFYSNREEFLEAADKQSHTESNVFFALATYSGDKRLASEAVELQSLFVDLDCGDKKEYPSQQEALKALQKFCKQTKFPKPIIVNSGYGIHAYWQLDEPLCVEEWQPLAEKFKAFCIANNLKIDRAVSADAARILRLPGSFNHKRETPTKVQVLDAAGLPKPSSVSKIDKILGDIKPSSKPVPGSLFSGVSPEALEKMRKLTGVNDLLTGNMKTSFKRILKKTAQGTGCNQLKIIATQQDQIDEPLWRAGLSIANKCVDRIKAGEIISNKHPDYDRDEMLEKMRRSAGPYLCSSFAELNPEGCSDCPHWGKIKSPIVLGNEVLSATKEELQDAIEVDEELPEFPNNYFRGVKGGIYFRQENEDGDEEHKLVYFNDLWVVKRLIDGNHEALVFYLRLPQDGSQKFVVPLHIVTSNDKFREEMAKKGIAAAPGMMKEIMNYTLAWANELQIREAADVAHRQYGWTEDRKSFVVGEMEIYPDRVELNHPSEKTSKLMPLFKPKGTLAEWKQCMEFYNRPGMEIQQWSVALSFGSILMDFLPNIAACQFHIYHQKSGYGKTAALLAAASVWADPTSSSANLKYLMKGEDTRNMRMNRFEVLHSLPAITDEISNIDSKEASQQTYVISDGGQRGRLEAGGNSEREVGRPWSLASMSSGNASILERVSRDKAIPDAEAQRVLEVHARLVEGIGKVEMDRQNQRLSQNCGHAGIEFVKYVISNQDKVQNLLTRVVEHMDKKAKLTFQNRYWSAHNAIGIAALMICRKLGLLPFDVVGLERFACELVDSNRAVMKTTQRSASQIINDYVMENWGSILQIKSTGETVNHNGLDALISPDSMPRNKIAGRYETDVNKLFLTTKLFKEWCLDSNINYSGLILDIKNDLGGSFKNTRITKGTKLNLPPSYTLIVDYSLDNAQRPVPADTTAD